MDAVGLPSRDQPSLSSTGRDGHAETTDGNGVAGRPPSGEIGICLSGGGIRSASFGLGALQVLQREGILGKAAYLSAVSGGSYIVGALALVAKGEIPSGAEHQPKFEQPPPDMPAFSRGSPEEQYLRNNLRYLTHGPGGRVAVVGRVLFGLLLNLLFFGTCLWAAMVPIGWAYGAAWPNLQNEARCAGPRTAGCTIHFQPYPASWWAIVVLAAAGGLAGLVWAGVAWRTPARRKALGAAAGVLVGAAAIVFIIGIGVPYVLAFLRGTVARYPATSNALAVTQGAAAHHSAGPLLLGVSAGLFGAIASVLGWLRSVFQPIQPEEKAIRSWLGNFAQRHRIFVINATAAIAGPLFTIALALLAINFGASHLPAAGGKSVSHILFLAVPVAGLVGVYVLADLNSWSLHPYFRQHLSQAFALGRTSEAAPGWSATMVETSDGRFQDAAQRPYECPYLLSESLPQASEFPTVLICASANVNDYGKVPTGLNATSFVFSNTTIGGPTVGECPVDGYEKATRFNPVTVPTAIAIAGAGISPEMNKLARWPLRFLMTLANVRLGVWLPNPDIVACQHQDKLDRLRKWAWTRILRKDGEALPYRRPRPRYLFRELIGRNRLDSHFIYVTDGGHYDDLGLIELLRRKCSWIYCVDGSDGKEDSFTAIGRAFSLARAEGLADIDLDPRAQLGPRDDGAHVRGQPGLAFVRSAFAEGTVRYMDGSGTAKLIIVKAGVTEDSPWDIRAWQEKHPEFPYDPGFNQFFTAEQFDAYRALGEYAMTKAVASHRPPGTVPIKLAYPRRLARIPVSS